MAEIRLVAAEPALIIEGAGRHLVVADLHVGFEAGLAAKGISVSRDAATDEAAQSIRDMAQEAGADSLVLLGDVKAGTSRITPAEWRSVPRFFGALGGIETTLVPGNHDAGIQRLLPDGVSVAAHGGMMIEDVLLCHGHAMPPEAMGGARAVVMGHLHPVFVQDGSVLSGSRVWVSMQVQRSCLFASRSGPLEVTVMPSFNRYFYAEGRRSGRKETSPVMARIRGGIESARIATLDGAIIGDESMLESVL